MFSVRGKGGKKILQLVRKVIKYDLLLYKKTFLKDLATSSLAYRGRIEKLVFEDIPKLKDIYKIFP